MYESYRFKNNEAYQKSIKRQQKMIKERVTRIGDVAKKSMPDISEAEFAKLLTTAVAGVDANQISNIVLSDSAKIYERYSQNNFTKGLANNGDILTDYSKFFAAAGYFTAKEKDSGTFMRETVNSAEALQISNRSRGKTLMTLPQIKEAWEQMQNGKYVVFDFETFGGKNKQGVQVLDQLTEYSFDFYDKLGTKKNQAETVEGIVGFSASKAKDLIRKYVGSEDEVKSLVSGKHDLITTEHLTSLEEVQIRSLAKFGDSRTKFENIDGTYKDGRLGRERVVETIANDEAVISKQNVLKGIRELERIGTLQAATKVDGMMAWEKDLADVFLKIQKEGIVKTGHNIVNADLPWMNTAFTQMSDAAQEYFFDKNGGELLSGHDGKTFDLLALTRLANTTGKLQKDLNKIPDMQEHLSKIGNTAFTQESLEVAVLKDYHKKSGMAAHTAAQDTFIFNQILTEGRIPGKKETFVEKLLGMADNYVGDESIKLNDRVFLNAKNGQGFSDSGVLIYSVDPLTGALQLSDGKKIKEDGTAKPESTSGLIKRDATYMLSGPDALQKISPKDMSGKALLKRMASHSDAFDPNEMYELSLSMMSPSGFDPNAEQGIYDKNRTLKAESATKIVGTKEMIQQWMDQNMVAYAEADKEGYMIPISSGMKQVSNFDVKNNKVVKTSIEDVLQRGYRKVLTDSVNRTFEEMNYGQIKKMTDVYAIALEEQAERIIKNPNLPSSQKLSENIDHIYRELLTGVEEIDTYERTLPKTKRAKHAVTGGKAPLTDERSQKIWDILKKKDRGLDRHTVDYRTLDKVRSSIDVMKSSYANLSQVIDMVEGKVDKDGKEIAFNEKKFLFRQIMEGMYAKWSKSVVDEEQSKTHSAANKPYQYIPAHERNKIELTRSSFMESGNAKTVAYQPESSTYKVDLMKNPEQTFITEAQKTLHMRQDGSITGRLIDMAKDNGIDVGDVSGLNRHQVAALIVQRIKEIRADDTTAFSPKPVGKFDVTNGISVLDVNAKEKLDYVKKSVENYKPGTVQSLKGIINGSNEDEKRKLINGLVDGYMMSPEIDYDAYGYAQEDAKFHSNARALRRKDYVAYAETLLKGIGSSGADLVFDQERGILGLDKNGEFMDLSKLVARDKNYNGISYTQVGGNKIRNDIFLGMFGAEKDVYNQSDVTAKSPLGKAMASAYGNIEYSIKRAIERKEEPMDAIKRWLKDVNSTLREGASVEHFGEKDLQYQGMINIENVMDNFGKIRGVTNMDADDEKAIQELVAAAQKDNWSFKGANDTNAMFMQKELQNILRFVTGGVDEEWIREKAPYATARVKASAAEKGAIQVLQQTVGMEDFSKIGRQIERQNDFLTYDEETARNILKTAYEYPGADNIYNRVSMGANMRTKLGAAKDEMTSREHKSRRMQTFELMRAHYAPAELTQAIADEYQNVTSRSYDPASGMSMEEHNIQKSREVKALGKLAMISNVTEGAAVINGRVAEAFFQNSDTQMKDLSKNLFAKDKELIDRASNGAESLTQEEIKRLENLGNLHLNFTKKDSDGGFKLSYGDGYRVNHYETIAQEYSDYGNRFTNVAARYDGVAKIGFFTQDKGHLVSADEVTEFLSQEAEKKKIKISSLQELMAFAKEYYTASLYVDKLEMPSYRKLQEDRSEKHMTSVALEALGAHDDATGKSVTATLERLGLGDLSGKLLDRKYFEELRNVNNFTSGVLARSVNATAEDYAEALKAGGFDNEEEFRKHIDTERYMASDILHRVTGADIALHSDDVSHANTGMHIKTAINNMQEHQVQKIMTERGAKERTKEIETEAARSVINAAKSAFKAGSDEDGIYLNPNGRIGITKDMSLFGQHVNIKELEDIYNKFIPDAKNNPRARFDSIMMTGGQVGKHEYGLMSDVTAFQGTGDTDLADPSDIGQNKKASLSGLKMTDRELALLQNQTYEEGKMNQYRDQLGDDMFKHLFSNALNDDLTLKDSYKDRVVLQDYVDQLKRDQYHGAGDTLLLDNQGNFVRDAPQEVKFAAQQLQKESGGNVSMRAAESLHSIASARTAILYNENNKFSADELTSGNLSVKFNKVKIEDLVASNGQDGAYVMGHENSMFNKNLLIDLSDPHLHGVTEAIGKDYVAIGNIPTSLLGDEVLTKDLHAAVNSIIHARQEIVDNGAIIGEKGIQRQKEHIVENIQTVNEAMDKIIHGKGGTWANLNSVRLKNSAFGKAMLMDMPNANLTYEKDLMPFLDKAEFKGNSLRSYFDKGINLDVKVFGMQHAQRMGLFDQGYLDKIGSTKEEVIDRLERGVMGITERFPAVYENANSSTMFVLNKNLGHEIIENAAGLLTRKGDADGDQPASAVGGYTDKSGRRVDAVEFALKQDRPGEFSKEIVDAYEHQSHSNVMNALDKHGHFQAKFDKANQEALEISQKVMNRAYELENPEIAESFKKMQQIGYGDSLSYSDKGVLYGGLPYQPSPERLNIIRADQDELHSRTLLQYAQNNNVELPQAQSHMIQNYGDNFQDHSDYQALRRDVVSNTADDVMRNRFEIAARFDNRLDDFKAGQMGLLKRGNAGQINLAMAKMRKLQLLTKDGTGFSDQDRRMFEHVMEASEEGFLSPKHSSREQVDNARMMEEFNRAMRSISNNPMAGDEAGTDMMRDWMKKNALGRIRNYDTKEDKLQAIDRATEMMSNIFDNAKNVDSYNVFLNALGQHTKGVGVDNILDSMAGIGTRSFASQTSKVLANAYGDLGHTHDDELKVNERVAQAFGDNTEFRGNSYQAPSVEALKPSLTGKLEAVKGVFNAMSGRSLAIGAVGLAGISLATSFIGGHPVKPASDHAARMDGSGGYEPIPLSDGGGQSSMAQQNNGYAITVNAQSDHSQQHVQEAIKNAVKSAAGGGVNISMTTRNEYGNLNTDSVSSLLTSSLM